MLASLLIMFRESLEAILIVGIVLSYLSNTGQKKYYMVVYAATLVAIISSVILAIVFKIFLGGFSGEREEIFEAIVMLTSSVLLSSMILWMLRHRNMKRDIEYSVENTLSKSKAIGLFWLIMLSILREGVETVVFLSSASLVTSAESNLLGAFLGLTLALFVGYFIFFASKKLDLKLVFDITNTLLILFAAGLIAQGLHELQELGLINLATVKVWSTENILPKSSFIGDLAKGLFGYNSSPSALEVSSYLLYLSAIFALRYRIIHNKI